MSGTPQQIDSATKARVAIIDEYGDLSAKMAAWRPNVNPHAQRHAELQLQILSWYAKEAADKSFIAVGSRYKIPVKMQRLKRTVINVPKLLKLIGLAKIAQLWEPPLGVIEKNIPKDKLPLFIKEERTGPRALDAPVLIDPEAPAA